MKGLQGVVQTRSGLQWTTFGAGSESCKIGIVGMKGVQEGGAGVDGMTRKKENNEILDRADLAMHTEPEEKAVTHFGTTRKWKVDERRRYS